jgi:hypothetical protein
MGAAVPPTRELIWDRINLSVVALSHLEAPFSLNELKVVVHDSHGEMARGPDGFTGDFFKKCWSLICHDMLAAMNLMHNLKGKYWNLLNSVSIVLLPKKNEPVDARDCRPVYLMHNIAKLLCKMLANRLAPELKRMVSVGQSAFIKGRSIQDNFLYV